MLHMAEVMRVDRQPSLFATELFLIQSQGMERMIGQSLADEFRCFCNYKFFLPLDFLEFIADRLGLGISPDGFQRQTLTWRLDGLLRDIEGQVYQPLFIYLSGQNTDLKRFQLARRLANIFDQYQIMRPDMLTKWQSGARSTAHPTELWQMDLWRRLLAQPGGDIHRGMQFSQVIDRLNSKNDFSGLLPGRISVIGLHTLPPMYLSYLTSLSQHMDIHFFLLSPCRNYWGNVQSKRTQLKRSVDNSSEHSLFAALGSQGRDLQNMMLEGADFALEFSSYADPLAGQNYMDATLLQRLQADLLEGRISIEQQSPLAAFDDTIQVVSCHSKLREISVLKDHLLNLLHLDSSLELRDIIVMAPDIQEYAPLIPAVFEDIQHSIADRSIRRQNSVIAAFLSFLDLFSGRFGWSEVLDLLRKPVVFPQFQLSSTDMDTLQQWIIGAGIRWGLSGQQRSEGGLLDFAETSWEAGLDRLLMGYAIDSDEFIDGVLPFADIEGRGAYALGGLCQFIEVIVSAHGDFQQSRMVSGWADKLLEIIQQLFGEAYEQELVELRGIVTELSESISPFHSGEVGFRVIREWLSQSTKESRSSTGFLRGQLTFCSMLPMRSIPFKVVCLIGLCDGVFPKNDTHDTFDLMGTNFRAGDRSPRADDRYQFMEAILAARSHLYLSYIGQSIRTNEVIPPSVVVTEFLEVLDNEYGAKDLVVRQPLHPFSKKYFAARGDAKLFSYDSYSCRVAATLERGTQSPAGWWQGRLDGIMDRILLSDLLRFYSNPQKFFIKDCLGIKLDMGEDLPDEREMFAVSGLDKYYVEEEMIRSGLAGKIDDIFDKIKTKGLWPLGTSGQIAFAEKRAGIEEFLVKVQAQEMGARVTDMPLDLEAGEYRLMGTLSNLYENGVLLVRYGNLRGRDLLAGWIHHLVLNRLVPSGKTRIVALDTVVGFSGDACAAMSPDLEALLSHFDKGCREPSALYVEPAFVYARQPANPRSRTSPLDKAMQTLNVFLEKGYEPEWALLHSGSDGQLEFIAEFEQICQAIMSPIWSAANE